MKQKTETMLCKAFIDLLKRYPFPKITIQMIATHCGVNRQTFYYHFDNVYDLMAKAFEYELLWENHLAEPMSWNGSMERFLSWMKKNRVIIKNLLTNMDSRYLRKAIYPVVLKCMSNIYTSNMMIRTIGETMEEDVVKRFMTVGITQYVLEWADNDYKEPEEYVIDNIFLIIRRMYGIET